MLKGIKFEKIKEIFRKLPRITAEHAFLSCLFLVFLALIFGAVIFYKYNILVKKTEPQILEEPFKINEKIYKEVLDRWQERQQRFEQARTKVYPNPFRQRID